MTGTEPRTPEPAPRPRLHVLVADDEPMIRDALERFLTRRGHAVRTASTAGDAFALLDTHRFDAALVDARMPGGGLTVIERLERDPDFDGSLVLMTGALATDPGIRTGPDVIRVQKPFRLTDLVPVLEGDVRR